MRWVLLLGLCGAAGAVVAPTETRELDTQANEIAQKAFADTKLRRDHSLRVAHLKATEQRQAHALLRESLDMQEMERAGQLQLEEQARQQKAAQQHQVIVV